MQRTGERARPQRVLAALSEHVGVVHNTHMIVQKSLILVPDLQEHQAYTWYTHTHILYRQYTHTQKIIINSYFSDVAQGKMFCKSKSVSPIFRSHIKVREEKQLQRCPLITLALGKCMYTHITNNDEKCKINKHGDYSNNSEAEHTLSKCMRPGFNLQ